MDNQLDALLYILQSMQQTQDCNNGVNDQPVQSPLMLLQAITPYLSPEYQKNINGVFQFAELQKTLNNYIKQTGAYPSDFPDWRRHLLISIKPHIPEKKQRTIDLLLKIFEIKEIMDSWRV